MGDTAGTAGMLSTIPYCRGRGGESARVLAMRTARREILKNISLSIGDYWDKGKLVISGCEFVSDLVNLRKVFMYF
jgi:hypothetical protein